MKIYHYTSIQTLALILKHKKIRFNRLDKVDDLEESIYGSGPTQTRLGKYTFVSCWTKSNKENLALWNMYTRYEGVRIGIDEMPFMTYKVNDKIVSLLPNAISIGDDYFMTSFVNKAKLYDIEYVDNPQAEIDKLIMPTNNGGIIVDITGIGTIKRTEWAMQEESRFKITVQPADVSGAAKDVLNNSSALPFDFLYNTFDTIGTSLAINKPISTTYIDLELDPVKLADIEIMMGPLTTDADKYIVESLLTPYPNAKIVDSYFLGKLRKKQ